MKLFPNPASDILNIKTNNLESEIFTLNIYNVIGGLVYSETMKKNLEQINVSKLNNGVYVVEIKSTKGSVKQKLVINK